MEKALILLKKKGADIASKKSDRTLGAGAVAAYIHGNANIGAMVLLQSETDFVSKNEEFKTLAYDIAMHVSATNPDFLSKEDIGEDEINKVREVIQAEIEGMTTNAGKPEELKEKILQGKLDAYFKEKNPSRTKFHKE